MSWAINMIICCAIGFGCFAYAIKLMVDAEDKKKKKEHFGKTS